MREFAEQSVARRKLAMATKPDALPLPKTTSDLLSDAGNSSDSVETAYHTRQVKEAVEEAEPCLECNQSNQHEFIGMRHLTAKVTPPAFEDLYERSGADLVGWDDKNTDEGRMPIGQRVSV